MAFNAQDLVNKYKSILSSAGNTLSSFVSNSPIRVAPNSFIANTATKFIPSVAKSFAQSSGGLNLGKGIGQSIDYLTQKSSPQVLSNELNKNLALAEKLRSQGKTSQANWLLNKTSPQVNQMNQQVQQLTQLGNKARTNVVLGATKAGLTLAGAKTINPLTIGAAGALGAGISKLTGQDGYEGAGQAIGMMSEAGGLGRLTGPIGAVVTSKFGPMGQQVLGRVFTGATNLAENEVLTRLDEKVPGISERLMSFGLGALMNGTANKQVADKFIKLYETKIPPEVKKQIHNTIREISSNWRTKVNVWDKVRGKNIPVPLWQYRLFGDNAGKMNSEIRVPKEEPKPSTGGEIGGIEKNLQNTGYDLSKPVGQFITPSGQSVSSNNARGIVNHWEVAVDAGYLPKENIQKLQHNPQEVVNGLLKKGWIRTKGLDNYEVWKLEPDIQAKILDKLKLYVDNGNPTNKTVYIDETGSGISHTFKVQDLIDNGFDLTKTLKSAEVGKFQPSKALDFSKVGSGGEIGGVDLTEKIRNPSGIPIDKRLSMPMDEVKRLEQQGQAALQKKLSSADKADIFFRSTSENGLVNTKENGIFFANDPEISKNYAGGLFETKPSQMYVTKLDIKKPYYITKDEIESLGGDGIRKLIADLKTKGYDALSEIPSKNPNDMGFEAIPTEVAVFDKSQVKTLGIVKNPEGRNLSGDLLMQRIKEVLGGSGGEIPKGVTVEGIQTGTKAPVARIVKPTIRTKTLTSNKPSQSQPIIPPGSTPKPEDVAATLPSRIDSFIQKTLGYTTEAPTGGNRGASLWTKTLRKGQESVTRMVEEDLASTNPLVRNAASMMQNFFKGLGMSPERSQASMSLRGEMATGTERAFNVMDSLYKSLKNNKGSLERINAVLDPDLAKIKVTFNQLSPTEQQVYKIIREGLDIVHDTSYANGHISQELFMKNRGKYTPRLYEVMELPPEVNKFVTQGKKIMNDMYKKRTEVTDWKMENALNDPVYALGKRLSQVETNSAIKKYTNFLASNPRFVSDVERAGFTKLSDSPAYGALKGKWVLNSAAEDLKGFFFSNEALNNLYDVFRAYDRMPIRQLQKKLLTVFNPTTNVGNIVSDQVFGFVTGVDPLTLNKNLIELKTNPSKYKQITDYLMRKGIIGTDITKTDFVNKMGQIDELAGGKQIDTLTSAARKIQSFYGGTDDVYKASAFKALLDKGFSIEEATRKVADGFQNYANVGKFYDVWSKTPIVGSAFIKFQGDLLRIIKNGAVNNPLGLIGFLGALWGVARLSSKLSGESDQDRITRENRFAAPMIPGLNIPLTWQTPWGEINAARYISPFYANNETTSMTKMLPFFPNIDMKKDVASNIAMNATDPLSGAPVQLLMNRDFRGKPISDPNENKWQPSTLTPQEKLTNQAIFAGRAYTPPTINSAIDVVRAGQGKPNMYGTPQTVPQAIARLGGIKISQFGPEEVEKIRQNDLKYQGIANDAIDKQVSSVTKGVLTGEVTEQQARDRIANLLKQKSTPETSQVTVGKGFVKVGDVYKYLDEKGMQQTIDLTVPQKPTSTGQTELDKKLNSNYNSDLNKLITGYTKLYELGELSAEEAGNKIAEIQKLKITAPKKPKKPSFKIKKVKFPKLKVAKVKKITVKKLKQKNYKIKVPKLKKSKIKLSAKLT